MIDQLEEWLPKALRYDIYSTVAILLAVWLLKKVAYTVLERNVKEVEMRKVFHYKKTIQYTFAIIALLLIGNIWITNFQSITTFLGLLSAGIAIALKDIFVNLAGWLFIYWKKPFDVGDRIQVGNIKGDVVDLRLFQFSLLEVGNWVDADQATGRIVHVPNAKVFMEAQANYSQGFNYIWHEQHVMLSLDSNFKKAKQLLLDILHATCKAEFKQIEAALHRAHKDQLISFGHFTPIVYLSIQERGIRLTMRYLCDPRKRRGFEDRISEQVLETLRQHADLRIVYPISTVQVEQKMPPAANATGG
ncbi:MAG: mechanosensitive ion channel family protein [Nitritalea sp.]